MPSKEDIKALKFLQATMRRTPEYQCADRGYWIGVKGKSKARSPINRAQLYIDLLRRNVNLIKHRQTFVSIAMAGPHTSTESQASLSLKAKVPTQPIAVMASNPELPASPMSRATNETEKGPEKADYITGLKLHIVLFGLTLVGFVIMLDQTIVATVRGTLNLQPASLTTSRPSHELPTPSIQSKTSAGMDRHTCSHCTGPSPSPSLLIF
jgi:hypothetical protein